MKIGILTFHRAINYGAVLQAYALKEILKRLGHDAFVIDYRQKRVERTDRREFRGTDKLNLLFQFHLRSFLQYNSNKSKALKKQQRFSSFIEKYLNLTSSCNQDNIPNDFDIYIVGSDQVWNSKICDGLDSVFWGNFTRKKDSKLYSYAASTSITDLSSHPKIILNNLLNNFNGITVREEDVALYINENIYPNIKANTVLDPTLLADKEIWEKFNSHKYVGEKYLLYFGARNYKNNHNILKEKAEVLASKLMIRPKTINFDEDSPNDFIELFKNATAVVTSSFHGVAFSLIFNKPLYAISYGDEQDSRYVNVLRMLNAEEMLFNVDSDLYEYIPDYTLINKTLESKRAKSLNFLKDL